MLPTLPSSHCPVVPHRHVHTGVNSIWLLVSTVVLTPWLENHALSTVTIRITELLCVRSHSLELTSNSRSWFGHRHFASVAIWKLNYFAGPMAWTSTFVTATCYWIWPNINYGTELNCRSFRHARLHQWVISTLSQCRQYGRHIDSMSASEE